MAGALRKRGNKRNDVVNVKMRPLLIIPEMPLTKQFNPTYTVSGVKVQVDFMKLNQLCYSCLKAAYSHLIMAVCFYVCVCVYSESSAVISRSSSPGRAVASDRPPCSLL